MSFIHARAHIYYTALLIQLQLSGIFDCKQFIASNATQKVDDISRIIKLGAIDQCSCNINSTFLSGAYLQCFDECPQLVTYRATLSSVGELSATELVKMFSNWIGSINSIVVQNVNINVDINSKIVFEDSNDMECSNTEPTFRTLPPLPTDIISASVAVSAILVIIIIIIVVLCVNKKFKQKLHVSQDSSKTR